MPDVDVVVVGSGAAGLCAALSAAESGASVLVAESESEVGGSSRLSGGVIMGAGTSVQRDAGIDDDDADRLYREYMAINQWQVVAALARCYADNCGPTIEWLISQGVEFHDQLIVGGDESRPRSHLVKGSGQGLVDALRRAAVAAGVDIAVGQRVDRLFSLTPVSSPPFYGVPVGPTVVNLTASGLRIDVDTRVLSNRGTPIAGLHAAGECVGGIIGPVYVGSGNSLGTCTTIGRLAGLAAAEGTP